MKIVKPVTLTLLSSSVPEAAPALWLIGTTYGDGDTAHTVDGIELIVWESIQAGNTGNAPASSPLWWTEIGRTYPEYSAGTTYAVDDRVINATTHLVYESLQSANTGNSLTEADSVWWLEIGSTNRHQYDDEHINTQVAAPDSITMTVTAPGRADVLTLFNISASSVTVTATDATDGVVYSSTTSLTATSGIDNWYAYFFTPIERQTNLMLEGIPPYSGLDITVVLTDAAETVLLGELVAGLSKNLGSTQEKPRIGTDDFSIKSQNAFGDTVLLERAYNDRGEFELLSDSWNVNETRRFLSEIRATPVVFLTENPYETYAFYGFVKTWDVFPAAHSKSFLSISVRGLT
jgi:hypothetical protein